MNNNCIMEISEDNQPLEFESLEDNEDSLETEEYIPKKKNPYFDKYDITQKLAQMDNIVEEAYQKHYQPDPMDNVPDEKEIAEVYRRIVGQDYSAPMLLVWTGLFQACFSESVFKYPDQITLYGNYYLHQMDFGNPDDMIVYSFGVGQDISFDKAITEEFKCPVYLFDPTPEVKKWLKRKKIFLKYPNFIFSAKGLNTQNGKFKLYNTGKEGKYNSSMFDIGHKDLYTEVKFKTLKTIMNDYKHNKIDILKLDIEGMALPVLEQMMKKTKIRPKQILAEFEIIGIDDPMELFPKILNLIDLLKKDNYKIYNFNLLRKATIEILAVREESLPIDKDVQSTVPKPQKEDVEVHSSFLLESELELTEDGYNIDQLKDFLESAD